MAKSLIIKIDGDDSSLRTKLNALGGVANTTLKAVSVGMTAVTGALGAATTAGMVYNSQMETYSNNFGTMLGSVEKANKLVGELKTLAASTPLEMGTIAKGTQTLLAFGAATEKNAVAKLKMLGDVALGDAAKVEQLTLAYSQMTSTGRLMGQDLLQMVNAGFNPLVELSQMGYGTMEQLKKDMEKGAISVDMVNAAFEHATSAGGKFYNAMQNSSHTTVGQISTLKDNIKGFFGEMSGTASAELTNKIFPALNKEVGGLVQKFTKSGLMDSIKKLSTQIADLVVKLIPKLVDGFIFLAKNVDVVATAVLAYVVALNTYKVVCGAVTVATKLFGVAMAATPIGLVAAAVSALVVVLGGLVLSNQKVIEQNNEMSATNRAEKILDEKNAYRELIEAQNEKSTSEIAEIENSARLWEQLTLITDENGNVLEANRGRAEFILSQLNPALGTEIELIDNQIQGYDTVKSKIYEQIEAEKAKILLDNEKVVYEESLGALQDAQTQRAKDKLAIDQTAADLLPLIQERQRILNEITAEYGPNWENDGWAVEEYATKMGRLGEQIDTLSTTQAQNNANFESSSALVNGYLNEMSTFEDASTKLMEGNSKACIDILARQNEVMATSKLMATADNEEQKEILGQQYAEKLIQLDEANKRCEENNSIFNQGQLAEAQTQAVNAQAAYEAVGGSMVDGMVAGLNKNGYKITAKMNALMDAALSAAKKRAGINSPSKVMRDKVGVFLADGIGVGIEKGTPSLKRKINSQIDAIKNEYANIKAVFTGAMWQDTRAKLNSFAPQSAKLSTTNKNTTTNKSTTNAPVINFYEPVKSPDVVSREINNIFTYGLAGDY